GAAAAGGGAVGSGGAFGRETPGVPRVQGSGVSPAGPGGLPAPDLCPSPRRRSQRGLSRGRHAGCSGPRVPAGPRAAAGRGGRDYRRGSEGSRAHGGYPDAAGAASSGSRLCRPVRRRSNQAAGDRDVPGPLGADQESTRARAAAANVRPHPGCARRPMTIPNGLVPHGDDLNLDELKRAAESILLVSGGPVTVDQLVEALGVAPQTVHALLWELQQDYAGRGIQIQVVAGGFHLCTRPELASYVQRFLRLDHREPLSQAALETLAIVAYRQPITRAEIEAVRGVRSDHIIERL